MTSHSYAPLVVKVKQYCKTKSWYILSLTGVRCGQLYQSVLGLRSDQSMINWPMVEQDRKNMWTKSTQWTIDISPPSPPPVPLPQWSTVFHYWTYIFGYHGYINPVHLYSTLFSTKPHRVYFIQNLLSWLTCKGSNGLVSISSSFFTLPFANLHVIVVTD